MRVVTTNQVTAIHENMVESDRETTNLLVSLLYGIRLITTITLFVNPQVMVVSISVRMKPILQGYNVRRSTFLYPNRPGAYWDTCTQSIVDKPSYMAQHTLNRFSVKTKKQKQTPNSG